MTEKLMPEIKYKQTIYAIIQIKYLYNNIN